MLSFAQLRTPEGFRTLIDRLGLSQSACARFLGVEVRTVQRWCSGDRDIPEPAVRFLHWLLISGADLDAVAAAIAEERHEAA